jgi:predicted phosphohydrolase
MNFQFASDLHLELANNKKAMLKKPLEPKAEILILAGDILPLHAIQQHADFLNYISDHFKMTYWLPGNHEYFDSDLAHWPNEFEEAIRPNIALLNHQVKELEDETGKTRLVFSTLWSHIPPELNEIMAKRMLDFRKIRWYDGPFDVENYNQLHQEALKFLMNALEPGKSNTSDNNPSHEANAVKNLVISHHLPSFLNFPKKHQKDPIKVGFASNLDDFIQKMAPNAWIFGHHHSNIQPFLIGTTQLYTNQLGTVNFKEVPGFSRSSTIIV